MRPMRRLSRRFTAGGETPASPRSRFHLRPLAFFAKEVMLSINVAKAVTADRSQAASTFRLGFYLIDFHQIDPSTSQIVIGPRQRRNFLLDARRAADLLQCPHGSDDHFRREFRVAKEGKYLQIFKEVSDETVRVSYFLQEHGEFTENAQAQLTLGEFCLLQRFIDYTLPFAFGWDAFNRS